MDRDALSVIEKIANYSYDNWHMGLNTMLHTHAHFAQYVEKNYRVKQYAENGDFYMTASEHYFHQIGFMDAIIWLHRSGFFNHGERDSDDYEPEDDEERISFENAAKEAKAVHRLIINFETGE